MASRMTADLLCRRLRANRPISDSVFASNRTLKAIETIPPCNTSVYYKSAPRLNLGRDGGDRDKGIKDKRRARGRDSCAGRTKPMAAFKSRKLVPRGTSMFREFSKHRNEVSSPYRPRGRLFPEPLTACGVPRGA